MKILRFDSVGGASGDMILGALLDLGADLPGLKRQLASLSAGKFAIEARKTTENHLTGTRVTVKIPAAHSHARHLGDIRRMIRKSRLSESVKNLSIKVFGCLAEAEARVHHTAPGKIHFHEVGAMDSVVDIVGSCAALKMLAVDAVTVGPLPEGSGTVECGHGILPVPAPATVEILKGHPVIQTDETCEMVTPTGAALLMTWKRLLPAGGMSSTSAEITRAGHGFGRRKLKRRPNLLRAMILQSALPGREAHADECLVIECNLDDMTPQLVGSLLDRVMKEGALDAFLTPVQMKKQRPGVLLTVLCRPGDRNLFLDLIFRESTTFGIREYVTRRTILARRHVEVKTAYGKVRVKIGTWKGDDVTRSPEYEDCLKLARQHDVPVRSIYEEALRGQT